MNSWPSCQIKIWQYNRSGVIHTLLFALHIFLLISNFGSNELKTDQRLKINRDMWKVKKSVDHATLLYARYFDKKSIAILSIQGHIWHGRLFELDKIETTCIICNQQLHEHNLCLVLSWDILDKFILCV